MGTQETPAFLTGVIEGFYGQPWSEAERFELFDRMSGLRLNTYLYAPKDDLKHRAAWRECYSSAEAGHLRKLIRSCDDRQIHFIYALSPGLDIRYARHEDLRFLQDRFTQMLSLGCRHFSLFFDDIPDRLDAEDIEQQGSLASAQCHVTNRLFSWLRERQPGARFLFCPTAYCGRMRQAALGGANYLPTLGRELSPGIDVFWTGPEIISRNITVEHIQEIGAVLRRKPLIWDNLHANDYDGQRFFCGPYSGRPPELRAEASGLLSNPNTEFPLNRVALHTLAAFVHCKGDWDPRASYLAAMQEWLPCFETTGQTVTLEDLILFGDCYYLPYEEGPEARSLYCQARDLLSRPLSAWGDQAATVRARAKGMKEFCFRLTELRDRSLFYSLWRRLWELREEMDLLERYIAQKAEHGQEAPTVQSDFHLPGTFRGGMVAKLQRLLPQQADGSFIPAAVAKSPVLE